MVERTQESAYKYLYKSRVLQRVILFSTSTRFLSRLTGRAGCYLHPVSSLTLCLQSKKQSTAEDQPVVASAELPAVVQQGFGEARRPRKDVSTRCEIRQLTGRERNSHKPERLVNS